MIKNNFNENALCASYVSPETKVLEINCEGVMCQSKTGGLNSMGLTDFGTSNTTDESSDWK